MVCWTLAAVVSGCTTGKTSSPRLDHTPISDIKLGEILLRDDFNDPAAARLPLNVNEPGIVQEYAKNEYHISLSSDSKQNFRAAGFEELLRNTQVAVEARLGGGTEARWVSVGCRVTMKDGKLAGLYALFVYPATDLVLLVRYDPHGEKFVSLIAPQVSESVRRGNAANHLELTCAGSTILGRVNGTLIGPVQDSTWTSGHVILGTGRNLGVSVSVDAWFDNIVVTEVLILP
jgi:hypothetical protein